MADLKGIKKGDKVIMRLFTGAFSGAKEVEKADKEYIYFTTGKGMSKFSRKTGKMIEPAPKSETYANFIEPYDEEVEASEIAKKEAARKKRAKAKKAEAKAKAKAKAEAEEVEAEEAEEVEEAEDDVEEEPAPAPKKKKVAKKKKVVKKPVEEDEDFEEVE